MNERFVAVSAVTGSRIIGCFSKPRRDFSVLYINKSAGKQHAITLLHVVSVLIFCAALDLGRLANELEFYSMMR